MLKYLRAEKWKDYELIDSGEGQKLERFGNQIFIRPEPQALWPQRMDVKKWLSMANARYEARNSNEGEWHFLKPTEKQWKIRYELDKGKQITFNLKFTSFKHLGVFPEQATNWHYLYNYLSAFKGEQPRVLNLFAYTGGASLAARLAGADIVHLDSIKTVVNWAADNMRASNLTDIRWIVEDALKFIQKEEKRGHYYHAIIMDPPSYGLGPKGERWKLEESIAGLVKSAVNCLDKKSNCLIMNTYSLNLSPLILNNLVEAYSETIEQRQFGELFVQSASGQQLPLGSYFRGINIK